MSIWAVRGVSDEAVIRIEVYGEDDPVRDERAARSLRDELVCVEGVLDVRFAVADAAPPPGARGPTTSDTVALLTTVVPAVSAAVIASVNAWAARSSRRKVRLSADGSVEVEGGVGRQEQQLVRDWQGRSGEHSGTGANHEGGVDG